MFVAMGKNKGNKGKTNNVFKVAGARSLKIKNKAKQVAGQLKKLNEVTRQKTAEADKQLASLHSTLMQKPAPVDKGSAVMAELKKINADNAKKAEEHAKRLEDINKLSEIEMST